MKQITAKEFEEVYNKGIVLVDFSASWCGPCKMLAPLLEELSSEITDVEFYKIDVDSESELAQKFNVMSIPTLILFKDGKLIDRVMGFNPKPAIINFINKAK